MSLVNDDHAVSLEQEVLKETKKHRNFKKLKKKNQENLSLNTTNIFIVKCWCVNFPFCKS